VGLGCGKFELGPRSERGVGAMCVPASSTPKETCARLSDTSFRPSMPLTLEWLKLLAIYVVEMLALVWQKVTNQV
jgi:hypothetical protein